MKNVPEVTFSAFRQQLCRSLFSATVRFGPCKNETTGMTGIQKGLRLLFLLTLAVCAGVYNRNCQTTNGEGRQNRERRTLRTEVFFFSLFFYFQLLFTPSCNPLPGTQ